MSAAPILRERVRSPPLVALSKAFGINPKTVAKWRKRQTVEDQETGPKELRSTVLSETDEAMIVAFRRHTLLPLDDYLYALQATIPHLNAQRCIAVFSVTGFHACLISKEISPEPRKTLSFQQETANFFL